jgi:Tol biopolymer transport system component
MEKLLEGNTETVDIANSPTLSEMATRAGILLGTAGYMSPEQAKAKPVDRRADIWAFGCVLYEMLTGKTAFHGETVTDTLASVIKEEPDWSQLPAATPMRVRVLLQRCLQKDPKERLQAIGDARITLNEVLSGAPELALVGRTEAVAVPLWRRTLPWVLFGLMTAVAVTFVYFREKPHASAAPVQRLEISAPDPNVSLCAVSPDGTRLAFYSNSSASRLWLRRMDSLEAHPIEGTEGAVGIPFWSHDSRFIAFGTEDGHLKTIDTEGGPAQVLCATGSAVVGGFWTPQGAIIFGDPIRQPGLWRVPSAGGVPSPLLGLGRGNPFLYFPVLLPDGRHFLYASGGNSSVADIYLGSLDTKAGQPGSKKLLTGGPALVYYAPSPDDPNRGYLLFGRPTVPGSSTATLMAQPFDLKKLEVVGDPVPVAEQASSSSASLTGTLVYASTTVAPAGQLTLFDRQGKILGTTGEAGDYASMAFSPDGKRLLATRSDPQSGSANLWMMDLARGVNTRFTFDPATDVFPVWSPDGNRVAFASNRGGHIDLYQKLSNGGGNDEPLFKDDQLTGELPLSWSGDGRFLLFAEFSVTLANASVLPLNANGHAAGKPFLFVQKGIGIDLRFSPGPQGRPLWVAYSSNESGRYEIYVRPFDPNSPTGTLPGGGKWQVSTGGGFSPRWNNDGKELFYVAPDGTVMSVNVSSSNGVIQSGTPRPLFKPKGFGQLRAQGFFYWDASPDGKKFIFPVSLSGNGAAPPTRFTVVLNWPSLLKK